jgi:hypothetical protein
MGVLVTKGENVKKLVAIPLLFLAIVFSVMGSGCDNTTYTIKVSGTEGLGYFGHYTWQRSADYKTKAMISDKVPKEYSVKGTNLSVDFSMTPGGSGELIVEVVEKGKVIANAKSSSPYEHILLEVP